MHRRTLPRGLSLALLSLAPLASSILLKPEISAGQEPVRQVRIRTDGQYVTSGAWSPSGLLLLNLAENRLERMQASGELTPLRPFEALAGWLRPLNEAGDLVVQMRNPDEWWAIRVGASSDWAVKTRWHCERCSIAHWSPLDAETILGVGEVRDEEHEEEWTQGIFWVTPDGPELAYPLEEEQLAMYLLGFQWVTVAHGKGFAIVPEPATDGASPSRFLQVIELPPYNRSHRVVTRLPIPVPELTAFESSSHLPETMATLSRQRIPMALVGWRDGLYLVEKTGETFYLWRIDTLTGGLHFLDTVPASDFVTVIPGRDWALLRKGPMLGFGQQQIQSVVLFPGSRLER
jgi:hypothetical protein